MRKLFTSALTLLVSLPAFAIDPITGPTSVCSGATITLSNATTGGAWTSSNVAIASVDASTGVVTGTLATATYGTATITYTAGAAFATSTITVSPTPVMTSTLTPPAICDSSEFNYIPMSSVPGSSFTWLRPYIPAIVAPTTSGLGGVSEMLDNASYFPITVKYLYTLSAYGCSNNDTVQVIVNPTPHLATNKSDSVCSGSPYAYIPYVPFTGTTLSWMRATVPGILNAMATGVDTIGETLINTTSSAIAVDYVYTMTIGSCTNNETLHVKVNACVSKVPEVSMMNIDVYPNPNQGIFTVTIPDATGNATTATLTISNILGQKVQQVPVRLNSKETISLDLPPGIYLLKTYTSAGMIEQKMMVR